MTHYFVIYSTDDLAVRASGTCEDGMTAAQAILPATAVKRISAFYAIDALEVRDQDGDVIVIDIATGQRVDIIPIELKRTN